MKLDAWLRQSHSMTDKLRVVERLAQALNEVHDRGEPLAALQPDNIEVAGDGRCDVSGARKGTPSPGYAAPERTEGGAPSPEADIYAAGAIAWEVLAGRPCGASPTHLSEAQPEVAQELADAVMACLERSAQWRPRDLTYLAQLAQHAQGSRRATEAPPARVSTARPAPRPAATRSARAAGPRSGGDGGSATRLRLAIGAVLTLAAAGAAAYFWLGRPAERALAPSSAATIATRPAATAEPPTTLAAAQPPSPAVAAPTPSVALTARPAPSTSTPAAASTPTTQPAVRPTPTPTAVAAIQPPVAAPRRPAGDATPAAVPPPVADTAPSRPAPPVTAPVAPPAATQANVATPTPAAALGPVTLTAVSPLSVRRAGKAMLDLRGSGLHDGVRVRILPLKDAPRGISVVRQKRESDTLLRVLVDLDDQVTPSIYAIVLEDSEGRQTKPLTFTVTK